METHQALSLLPGFLLITACTDPESPPPPAEVSAPSFRATSEWQDSIQASILTFAQSEFQGIQYVEHNQQQIVVIHTEMRGEDVPGYSGKNY